MQHSTIAIISSLDTKGEETEFTAKTIKGYGHNPLLVDTGFRGVPMIKPDITREEVARAAGSELAFLSGLDDRAEAISIMSRGLSLILTRLYKERSDFKGVLALGGGCGTALATEAMQVLPLGFPKVMVSTALNGDVANFLRGRDIILYPSITDIEGLNPILTTVLHNASAIICTLAEKAVMPSLKSERNMVALTMFGITTPCVSAVKKILESKGLMPLVFHANGAGGRIMEELIRSGYITGVMDITTTELTDELMGGIRSAGPERLSAAAEKGIPQVVCPGAIEAINFGPEETVPSFFKDRLFYRHTANATLVRINKGESAQLGRIMAEKLNSSTGPAAVLIPLGGFSEYDKPGRLFYDKESDRVFIKSLEKYLTGHVKIVKIDAHINDPLFSRKAAEFFLELLECKQNL